MIRGLPRFRLIIGKSLAPNGDAGRIAVWTGYPVGEVEEAIDHINKQNEGERSNTEAR